MPLDHRLLDKLARVPGVFDPSGSGSTDERGPYVTLIDRLREGLLSTIDQIDIALALCGILAAVHREGVIHGNLTASNVLFLGSSPEPLITNFGRASLSAEAHSLRGDEAVLASLAPEQTGRTGRGIDQRADLYGLGVTLYQMATGALPFEETDSLRLVRDVLATIPVPVIRRVPASDPTLSAIVQRLLEKEPDRRYQTPDGLAHDLRQLRAGRRAVDQVVQVVQVVQVGQGQSEAFVLGEHDFPTRLSAPSRLAGRQSEVHVLATALDNSVRGTCHGVLVRGTPGVGKTTLVNELRPMVTALGGWFVSGKSDQYRRDLASDAVSQALRYLGRLLLTETDQDLQCHRVSLRSAVGANGSLIASLQPELALVLGVEDEPSPSTGDDEYARDRVIRASLDILGTIASPHRPLVVFIDDLQWVSPTSLSLIDAYFQEDSQPGLLLVGAYRAGDVDSGHPLSRMLAAWNERAVPPVMVSLSNLPREDLGAMIGEMLRLPPQPAAVLAQIVGARTGGNPFDTIALLNALREDGALHRDDRGWRWDAATIERHVGEGDVVDLLATRIERLAPVTASTLRRLACLGGEVDADLLCLATGLSRQDIDDGLAPAFHDGLLSIAQGGDSGTTAVVRFRHDRVQQAATSGLRPDHLRALHLDLARRLAPCPEYAPIAAEQYLPAAGLVTDPDERRRVVELFRGAAHELRLVNPTMTERFLSAALSMVDEMDTSARIALETSHHCALYHLGWLDQADERYRSLESLQPTPLELTPATCERISGLTFRERPEEAVAVGLDMLRRLGVQVPEDDRLGLWTQQGLERIRQWVATEGVAEDLARPEASDPCGSAAADLFNRMIPPAFFVGMPIMPWLVFECQRLWNLHGPCAALVGPLSHADFATILLAHDYGTGYQAARRVLAVCEDHDHEPETSHALLMLALSAAHWFEPLETVVCYAQRALDGLLRGGDRQNAGFSAYCLIPTPLECTPTLEEYLSGVDARLAFAVSSGNHQTFTALVVYRQLARCLLGQTVGLDSLTDGSFDAEAHLAANADNPVASAYARVVHALVAVFSGDFRYLDEHTAAAMALLPVYEATLSTAIIHVLRALSLAESLRTFQVYVGRHGQASDPFDDRAAIIAEINKCREWLAQRALDNRGNFEHLLDLVDAERAWAFGESLAAAQSYDAALRAVRGRQRPWHAALIAERAAAFHLTHGLEHTGFALLAEARDRYRAWGALAKVRALETRHVPLHEGRALGGGVEAAESVDLVAIIRACQVFSSETRLDRLDARVREVLSAATGATEVRIVVWRDEPRGWFVPMVDPDGVARGPGMPIDDPDGGRLVPLLAFRYAERTLEPLVVADVACDERFVIDPYLRERRCRSLLIVPILSHGMARAMLILEQRLTGGAFTTDRLNAVQIIASQLAVSLENVILYEELEERVRQRTRELRVAQNELITTARRVGMAEIAANVLHNVGNVLTSVNVSANLAIERVRSSKVDRLAMAVALIHDHGSDLGHYLTSDPTGRLLPEYLSTVAQELALEREDIGGELRRLVKNIDHIMDIVATQQTHVGPTSITEPTEVEDLLADAVRVNAEALESHNINVVRALGKLPLVSLDKVRVLVILVNLVSNAQAAMAAMAVRPRVLTLSAEICGDAANHRLRITVEDSGEGIRPEHLARIFTHGFTTRARGHGYGLHSCALAAREMGGTLTAASEGPGRGATFVLDIPVVCEETRS